MNVANRRSGDAYVGYLASVTVSPICDESILALCGSSFGLDSFSRTGSTNGTFPTSSFRTIGQVGKERLCFSAMLNPRADFGRLTIPPQNAHFKSRPFPVKKKPLLVMSRILNCGSFQRENVDIRFSSRRYESGTPDLLATVNLGVTVCATLRGDPSRSCSCA